MCESKTCRRCKQTLPLLAFNLRTSSQDGRQSYCRDCQHEYYTGAHDDGIAPGATFPTVDEMDACLPGPLTGRIVAYIIHGKLIRVRPPPVLTFAL